MDINLVIECDECGSELELKDSQYKSNISCVTFIVEPCEDCKRYYEKSIEEFETKIEGLELNI